jgi:WD40 repeat protein
VLLCVRYGHGSELFALGTNHSGTLVASACKGKAKPHTDVLIWSKEISFLFFFFVKVFFKGTSDWKLVGRLSRHKMTVTRIAFSHSDEFIATVSRDLRLCLWKRVNEEYQRCWDMEKVRESNQRKRFLILIWVVFCL